MVLQSMWRKPVFESDNSGAPPECEVPPVALLRQQVHHPVERGTVAAQVFISEC